MLFWIVVITVTAIACAALYYAARGRAVNAGATSAADPTTEHFRLQLREIEADAAAGRLGREETAAARGELARELLLRKEAAGDTVRAAGDRRAGFVVPLSVVLVAVVAFGTYGFLGSPGMPSAPLAARSDVAAAQLDLDSAIARIEAQLARTPDDLRGWTVIAPAYMQMGRFADAEHAYRRVLELGGATADAETDLAEAIMMGNGGNAEGEPMALFESAAARDKQHVRSRYYLAAEAYRAGDYEASVGAWNALVALAEGDEAWLPVARQGLAAAEAALAGDVSAVPDEAAVAAMVDGLAARLEAEGGSVAEWTRLVRSRLVLGQTEAAQAAYLLARAAHPDAATRTELDVLAADNGLLASEAPN